MKLSGHTINANSSIILVKLYHKAEYEYTTVAGSYGENSLYLNGAREMFK